MKLRWVENLYWALAEAALGVKRYQRMVSFDRGSTSSEFRHDYSSPCGGTTETAPPQPLSAEQPEHPIQQTGYGLVCFKGADATGHLMSAATTEKACLPQPRFDLISSYGTGLFQ